MVREGRGGEGGYNTIFTKGATSEVPKVCAWAQGELRLGVVLSCSNFLLAPPVEYAVTHFIGVITSMPATHEGLPQTRSISLPSEFSFTSTKPRHRCEESHDAVGIQQFVA
jgi:hypothetical protein